MMDLEQFLLGKLAEEGSEVAQISLKTQQFGLHEVKPGQPFDNAERTHQEIDDFMTIVEMLNDIGLGYVRDQARVDAKKDKVVKFLKLSIELGKVHPSALHDIRQ